MLAEACNVFFYTLSFLSLIFIDYLLGNGFVDACQKILWKIVCFIQKSLKEEKNLQEIGNDVNLPLLLVEIVVLGLTISVLWFLSYIH